MVEFSVDALLEPKSKMELPVMLRLPNVSEVPLRLSVPPLRTMLTPGALKLALRVSVAPGPTMIVPAPVIDPPSRLVPELSVRVSPEPAPRASVPLLVMDLIVWLKSLVLRIEPVLMVIAFELLKTLAAFAMTVPAEMMTLPAKVLVPASARVPVPSLVRLLAAVPVIGAEIVVLP